MQAAVGCSAPTHHRAAPATSLRRPLVAPSPLMRSAFSLTLTLGLSCQRNSAKIKGSSQVRSCRCSSSSTSGSSTSASWDSHADWDWATWNRHFSEIDQAESFLSVLQFQLEEAIEKEDFLEAAKLKKSIAEATSKDVVAEVMSELKNAIKEQRYHDASRLSRLAGTGLIGWWVSHAKDSDISFGSILRITPEVGRYVARSYSPRQLLVKSSGTPLFEIFLLKDDDGKFTMKVVSLQATKLSKPSTDKPSSKQETDDSSSSEKDNNALTQESRTLEKPNVTREEVLKTLHSLMKRIKVQFPNHLKPEKLKVDMDSVQQLLEQEEEEEGEGEEEGEREGEGEGEGEEEVPEEDEENETGEDSVDDIGDMNQDTSEIGPDLDKMSDKVKLFIRGVLQSRGEVGEEEEPEEDDEENETGEESGDDIGDMNQDTSEIGPSLDKESDKVKLFIGGVLHNREDVSAIAYRRVPAEVRCMEKDSFVIHIPGKGPNGGMKGLMEKQDILIAQIASDLMPSDVATAFLGASKGGLKGRKTIDMQGLLSSALSEVQNRLLNGLSKDTVFNRISADTDSLDPFTGLYVGSFGPYGPEVVQLRRKYGHWGRSDKASSGLEFFEYVEAVKLTGDFNVPAGEVTFRAKIGKGNKVSNDGIFPEGLGVTSFYSGQGRTAQMGFKNPQWVQGELLELNGKGMGPIKGAELGFLYYIPDQSFLVLFNRLHLPQ